MSEARSERVGGTLPERSAFGTAPFFIDPFNREWCVGEKTEGLFHETTGGSSEWGDSNVEIMHHVPPSLLTKTEFCSYASPQNTDSSERSLPCKRIHSLKDCDRCSCSAIRIRCYALGCTLPAPRGYVPSGSLWAPIISLSPLDQFCCCHTDGTLEQRTEYSNLERTRTAGKQRRRRNGDLHWGTCRPSVTHPCCCNSNLKCIRINRASTDRFCFLSFENLG